ncbi:MAG: hypothetical protein KKH94_07475 [Candidatus Omnitrophica bacterium]|nr:hypothetical protein [Candidatus Omnitrophota bacterium]
MGVGRISTNYAFIRSLRNISDTFVRLDGLRERMNTGKDINRPSDNPTGMQQALTLGSSIRANEQYQKNINSALGRLNLTSTTLTQVEDILIELADIATTAASEITSSAERGGQVKEVELLLEQIVHLANTRHQNKYIFGGTNTVSGARPLSQPFNIQYDSNGYISGVVQNSRGIDTLVYTTILQGVRDSMNISGSVAFQPNGAQQNGDIFDMLVNFRRNLQNNDITALQRTEQNIQNALGQVLQQNTIVGAKINRVEISYDTLNVVNLNETDEKSLVEDSDYAKLLIEYSTAEVMLNASLSATSTLLQNSLINFI